jgi:RNA polymerase sigma-70 factor (ECF subfamily)
VASGPLQTTCGSEGVRGETLEKLFEQLRPKLHRYCARMTGSVIDGEDVVQEALVKALEALPRAGAVANPEGWLFRIAHNAALDFLRRRARHAAAFADDEDLEMIADPTDPGRDAYATVASLRTFMRLPTVQRSAVILVDVLGYTLAELGEIAGGSILKSALQRGRARLRELASEPEAVPPPALTAFERARLLEYAARFNARDFDAVRDMLAADVRLDLVNRLQRQGRSEVAEYFHRYALDVDWRVVAGVVDGRPALLVFETPDEGTPAYFILVDWRDDSVASIRDFRFARYAIDGAELLSVK